MSLHLVYKYFASTNTASHTTQLTSPTFFWHKAKDLPQLLISNLLIKTLPSISTCTLTSNSFNRLTPNDSYMGRTAPLTSKRYILYIYSTNTGTEYFKHALYSPFFSLQNADCFIMLTCLVPVLFTFYIQSVLKIKKITPAPKG